MTTALISTVFANTIPPFLWICGSISTKHLVYFLLSETVFWLSYICFSKNDNIRKVKYEVNDKRLGDLMFYFSIILLWVCNVLTYVLCGIPVFMESRLDTYSSGGGIGILDHINSYATVYCSVYSYYLLSKKNRRISATFSILSIVLFSILSGSKSAILVLLFGYFFYVYVYENKTVKFESVKKYIPFILAFPLLVLSLQSGGDLFSSIIPLFNRFIANGDCFWMAYPDDVIDKVRIGNKFTYLFSRILGPLRIISRSDVDTVIGLQVAWNVNPETYGLSLGPNTRLPILGWVLFRWNGIILSAFVGAFCAWWKTWLLRYLPSGIIPTILYAYVYINLVSIFTDPITGSGKIFSILVFITILGAYIVVLNKGIIKLKRWKQ
jgi:hypothetical protein